METKKSKNVVVVFFLPRGEELGGGGVVVRFSKDPSSFIVNSLIYAFGVGSSRRKDCSAHIRSFGATKRKIDFNF